MHKPTVDLSTNNANSKFDGSYDTFKLLQIDALTSILKHFLKLLYYAVGLVTCILLLLWSFLCIMYNYKYKLSA